MKKIRKVSNMKERNTVNQKHPSAFVMLLAAKTNAGWKLASIHQLDDNMSRQHWDCRTQML
jgi:hypothetical protein